MVWIDYAIIGVIAFSTLVSLTRGFVREALSMVIWVGAFFIAAHFYPYLTDYITGIQDEMLRKGAAIAILFVATLIVGAVISHVIGTLVKYTGLSGTDRVLGICFGALRGILIAAAMLFCLDSFTSLSNTDEWKQSELIPHFRYIIEWFFEYLRNNSDLLSDTSKMLSDTVSQEPAVPAA